MSFSIVLQTNNSDKIQLDKSITDLQTLTGTLRNQSSITDPVILIAVDAGSLTACNYCTISEFGRSYFINNIVSVRNGLSEIHCHCDVLSSFAAGIRSNTAIVRRQENNWNLYLNDGTFKIYQNPEIITKPFPSGFSTQQYVLAVAGG